MSCVIYLIEQALDARNYERFGIGAWIERGWKVQVWDLTPLSQPLVWREQAASSNVPMEPGSHLCVTSKSQLAELYAKLAGVTHFVDFAGDNSFTVPVKMRLVRSGVKRIVCSIGAIPVPGGGKKSGLIAKLGKAFSVGPVRTLKTVVNLFASRRAASAIAPALTVVSGAKSIPPGVPSTVVEAHNLDYDIFLKLRRPGRDSGGDYAVFIDQNYCFHPEYTYQNVPRTVTAQNYFPAICRGLQKISQALHIDARIAAHPRSQYQEDYFGSIPVVSGNTAELIRDCKVVVCHDSTAIQLAVLFEKPVIFVTTRELDSVFFDSSFKKEAIAFFAAELGKTVINLDDNLDALDWQAQLTVDREKYAAYRRTYIKMDGSPETPFWDIVINRVEKDNGPAFTALGVG